MSKSSINIILLEDLPERGRRWKRGTKVFNVERSYFEEFISQGRVRIINEIEPIWSGSKDEEE